MAGYRFCTPTFPEVHNAGVLPHELFVGTPGEQQAHEA